MESKTGYRFWEELDDNEQQIVKKYMKLPNYNVYCYLVKHGTLVDFKKNVHE